MSDGDGASEDSSSSTFDSLDTILSTPLLSSIFPSHNIIDIQDDTLIADDNEENEYET